MVAATRPVALDFAAFLRPRTVIGRLQGLRTVVANVRTLSGGGAVGHFVAEGMPIPVSEGAFSAGATLIPTKVGAIVVATTELVRSASPDADLVLAEDLAAGVAAAVDVAFLDPLVDGNGEAPESITHGAVAIASSGNSLAAIDSDLRALLATFDDAGLDLASPAFIMSKKTFTFLSLLRGSGGAKAFPELADGFLLGIPVFRLPLRARPAVLAAA